MREKIFDDIAGMIGGAAGVVADLRDQIRSDMRDRLKGVADRIDLVTQEEHMALMARIEGLEAQVAKLEALLGAGEGTNKKVAQKTVQKTASKTAQKAAPKKAAKDTGKDTEKDTGKNTGKTAVKKASSAAKSAPKKGN